MAKKVLFEVRELSTDPAFQVVEDDNGELQTHFGATYSSETPTNVGAKWNFTNTALVDPTGVNPYGKAAPDLDADGNIIANVNLRTGALDTLLTLAGGAGEVGVATDVDALVRYTGVQGEAKAFYQNKLTARAGLGVTSTDTDATSTVFTPLALNDDDGKMQMFGAPVIWTAGAPTEIVLPVITGAYGISVSGLFVFGANATGTVRRVRLEVFNGSVWTTASIAVNVNTDAACSATDPVASYIHLPGSAGAGYNRFRITAASSAGVALAVTMPGGLDISAYRL